MSCRPLNKIEYAQAKSRLNKLRDKCLLVLGSNTGFRISELLSIKIKDVYKKDRVKVNRNYMKGKIESREIFLNKEVQECINEYLSSIDSIDLDSPLFVSRQGENKPMHRTRAHQILKEAFQGMGGTVASHSMRKSFAKNIHAKLGNDIVKTSKALGHSSIITTVKYLNVFDDEINEAVMELGE